MLNSLKLFAKNAIFQLFPMTFRLIGHTVALFSCGMCADFLISTFTLHPFFSRFMR